MAEQLPQKQRIEFLSGTLIPMIAKIGGLKEIKKEDISKSLATLAIQSEEDMQGFREDMDKVVDLLNAGKGKKAEKFYNEMRVEYDEYKFPWTKPIFDHFGDLLKEERTSEKGKEEKEEEREYEAT